MNGSTRDWERYKLWNQAIADVIYSPAQAGRPVYLDLEDDVLEEIRNRSAPTEPDPTQGLINAVKGTLRLTAGPKELLEPHMRQLERWRKTDQLEPPPTLGLLALLSLAAENMQEGDGHAASNFYGRLGVLLGLNERQVSWFADAYRSAGLGAPASEKLWQSLTDWLDALEGNRGLPTAYAETHAHVGLALSQALVRATDRERLEDLFVLYGLSPRSSMPGQEMEQLINEWVKRENCVASNTFIRLWHSESSAKERISEVACLALEAWDGTTSYSAEGAPQRRVDSVRATAVLRHFPGRLLTLGLLTPVPSKASVEEAELLDRDGKVVGRSELIPTASGWWTLSDPTVLDTASFLGGQTELRVSSASQHLTRRPRRLIPLRQDDLVQMFVEAERVNLGEETMLLATQEIAERVEDFLQEVARPGFTRVDQLAGLPPGWTLFSAVQILSPIPSELLKQKLSDLNVLQPIASSRVVLAGGLKIPGSVPKWLPTNLPEVRITADHAQALVAMLDCKKPLSFPAPEPRVRTADQPALVWDLSEEYLSDGDYELRIAADGVEVGRPITIRIRSADHPAVEVPEFAEPLRHESSSALFGLSAHKSFDNDTFAIAPIEASDSSSELGPAMESSVPHWYSTRQGVTPRTPNEQLLVVPRPTDDSCILTGFHHIEIETAHQGMKSVEGVCKHCGLVKRYPTRGRRKRTQKTTRRPMLDVHALPTVQDDQKVSWDSGFEALCHLGGGRASVLGRVASQMETGGLFSDAFARNLETVGHMETVRDPNTLEFSSWKMNDPTLVEVAEGEWHLLGYRSERMLANLEDTAYEHGLDLTVSPNETGPAVVCVRTDDQTALAAMASTMRDSPSGRSGIVPRAARSLAQHLPSLSAVANRLPHIINPGARTMEWWDPTTARFKPAQDTDHRGAYRLSSFGRSYVYRNKDALQDQTAIVGDARLVKYLAALESGISLIGYDSAKQVLYVPLGADLPGLYGRAASLASGRAPHSNPSEGLLEYPRVTPDLAERLKTLLTT